MYAKTDSGSDPDFLTILFLNFIAASLDFVPEDFGFRFTQEERKAMLVELWMWLILVLMSTLIVVQNIGLRERVSKLESTLPLSAGGREAGENRGQAPKQEEQESEPRKIRIGV